MDFLSLEWKLLGFTPELPLALYICSPGQSPPLWVIELCGSGNSEGTATVCFLLCATDCPRREAVRLETRLAGQRRVTSQKVLLLPLVFCMCVLFIHLELACNVMSFIVLFS